MTGSDRTNFSASMSGAPSLVNGLNSFSSSTKLTGSQTSVKSPVPEINFVDNLLEKAKFYTSLCLGKYDTFSAMLRYEAETSPFSTSIISFCVI